MTRAPTAQDQLAAHDLHHHARHEVGTKTKGAAQGKVASGDRHVAGVAHNQIEHGTRCRLLLYTARSHGATPRESPTLEGTDSPTTPKATLSKSGHGCSNPHFCRPPQRGLVRGLFARRE